MVQRSAGWWCLVWLAGCGDAPSKVPNEAVEYYPEIQRIMAENCVACHQDGSEGPFALDSYEAVSALVGPVVAAVESGEMPPWHADPTCSHFEGERVMAEADKEALRAWADAGSPMGDPANAAEIEPPTSVSFVPSHQAVLAGYEPPETLADDWRCFVFPELVFEEETWLVGSEVVPGSPAVHHVLVYALEADQAAVALAADEAESGLGYTCFGGPVPGLGEPGLAALSAGGFPNQIGIWVPGMEAELLEDGTARRVSPGSLVVAQVHYNMLYVEPEQDLTEVRFLAADSPPDQLRQTGALAYYNLDIPAGEANVQFSNDYPYHAANPLEVVGFTGHMHMLGTSLDLQVTGDAAEESCLVDIPRWDFHWQQRYGRAADDPLQVNSGETLRLTCSYDNSAENQPVVDGVQQAPRDVIWGESSLDEMCLLYVERLLPYAPLPAPGTPACAASSACMEACEGSDTRCLLDCEETSADCLACALGGLPDCAVDCAANLIANKECVSECGTAAIMLGANMGSCLQAECPEAYAEFATCFDAHLADGSCATVLEPCGI